MMDILRGCISCLCHFTPFLGRFVRPLRHNTTRTQCKLQEGPGRSGKPPTSANGLFSNADLHIFFRSKAYEFGSKMFIRSQAF